MIPVEYDKGNQGTDRKKGIFQFFLFVIFFVFFFSVVAPRLDKLGIVQPLIRFIDDRNIEATALFYTEIGEFSDAQIFMTNSREFSPRDDD